MSPSRLTSIEHQATTANKNKIYIVTYAQHHPDDERTPFSVLIYPKKMNNLFHRGGAPEPVFFDFHNGKLEQRYPNERDEQTQAVILLVGLSNTPAVMSRIYELLSSLRLSDPTKAQKGDRIMRETIAALQRDKIIPPLNIDCLVSFAREQTRIVTRGSPKDSEPGPVEIDYLAYCESSRPPAGVVVSVHQKSRKPSRGFWLSYPQSPQRVRIGRADDPYAGLM